MVDDGYTKNFPPNIFHQIFFTGNFPPNIFLTFPLKCFYQNLHQKIPLEMFKSSISHICTVYLFWFILLFYFTEICKSQSHPPLYIINKPRNSSCFHIAKRGIFPHGTIQQWGRLQFIPRITPHRQFIFYCLHLDGLYLRHLMVIFLDIYFMYLIVPYSTLLLIIFFTCKRRLVTSTTWLGRKPNPGTAFSSTGSPDNSANPDPSSVILARVNNCSFIFEHDLAQIQFVTFGGWPRFLICLRDMGRP